MVTAEPHTSDGPLLLLAAPGTGKTYTLARRIKHLVEERNVDPGEITVITFTGAAASEMSMRISDTECEELCVPHTSQPRTICTMHALGHRIICEKASELDLPASPAVVVGPHVRDMLMQDAAQLAGFTREEAKEACTCRQMADCEPSGARKCQICQGYERILRACGAVDHDDQILLACKLLDEDADLLARYSSAARHLLVDEYQDINAGQFRLIGMLTAGQAEGLFAVGDDDQSIYSWRGGSPQFIRDFEDHYGSRATVTSLPRSYRCHTHILDGALSVVEAYDQGRRDKGTIEYEAEQGPRIVVHNAPSAQREAGIIGSIVERSLPASVLVLVPNRRYVPLIAGAFRRARIEYLAPATPPGSGFTLLDRVRAWLIDDRDNLALRECIEAMVNNGTLGVPSSRVRTARKKAEREAAFSVVSQLWRDVIGEGMPLWDSLQAARSGDDLLEEIHKNLFETLTAHGTDASEFVKVATDAFRPWRTAEDLLEEVSAWVSASRMEARFGGLPTVRIMTMQGAKGLEADVVCLVGLEEGVVPRTGAAGEALAEQSRLLYVSMTRARRELHLFHCRQRPAWMSLQAIHGPGGSHILKPSRFLQGIPREHVKARYHPARTK